MPERLVHPGNNPPEEEAVSLLCALFAELLGRERVGPEVDFFASGGHSLLALRLLGRIRADLGVELPLLAVFEAPSPARLASRLVEGDSLPIRPPLLPEPRPRELPVARPQRRMWFLNRLYGSAGTYNLPIAHRLYGDLDVSALQQALDDLVARHETLRTVYPDREGRPVQVVLPMEKATTDLDRVQVTEEALPALLAEVAMYPFDLAAETPLRAHLLQIGAGGRDKASRFGRRDQEEHVLLLVIHHIAADGWSLGPLADELTAAYSARLRGAAPDLPSLPVQYADYAIWQNRLLGHAKDPESLAASQLTFWRRELAAVTERDLDLVGPRGDHPGHRGGRVAGRISAEVHRAVYLLARNTSSSPFLVAQAALAVLLTRHGAGEDVRVGTPVAGRTDPALDCLIGFFVNTLVLRTRTGGDPTFRELLGRVRSRSLAALSHQDVPFDELVAALNPGRSPDRHPFFQVMFAYQNNSGAQLKLAGVTVVPEPVPEETTRFDLRFELQERFVQDRRVQPIRADQPNTLAERPDGIDISLTHALDVVSTAGARTLLSEYCSLLSAAAADPDARLSELGHDRPRRTPHRQPDPSELLAAGPAFVCSPYGQQWPGMGRGLYAASAAFRETLDACDAELAIHAGWSLVEELHRDEPAANSGDVGVMQPVVFGVQLGLAACLEAQGVVPGAVVGHSIGEIAACVIAGSLGLSDAVRVVYHYADQQRRVAGPEHGMAVVELSFGELSELLRARRAKCVISARNGPRTTVLSGDRAELSEIVAELRQRDVLAALIRVDLPAHGPAIDQIMPDLERAIGPLRPRRGRIPMISSVTGEELRPEELTGSYFARNLRSQVRLDRAIKTLLEAKHLVLLEIAAHPVLLPALRQCTVDHPGGGVALGTMRRAGPQGGQDDRTGVREALTQLAAWGLTVTQLEEEATMPVAIGTAARATKERDQG